MLCLAEGTPSVLASAIDEFKAAEVVYVTAYKALEAADTALHTASNRAAAEHIAKLVPGGATLSQFVRTVLMRENVGFETLRHWRWFGRALGGPRGSLPAFAALTGGVQCNTPRRLQLRNIKFMRNYKVNKV